MADDIPEGWDPYSAALDDIGVARKERIVLDEISRRGPAAPRIRGDARDGMPTRVFSHGAVQSRPAQLSAMDIQKQRALSGPAAAWHKVKEIEEHRDHRAEQLDSLGDGQLHRRNREAEAAANGYYHMPPSGPSRPFNGNARGRPPLQGQHHTNGGFAPQQNGFQPGNAHMQNPKIQQMMSLNPNGNGIHHQPLPGRPQVSPSPSGSKSGGKRSRPPKVSKPMTMPPDYMLQPGYVPGSRPVQQNGQQTGQRTQPQRNGQQVPSGSRGQGQQHGGGPPGQPQPAPRPPRAAPVFNPAALAGPKDWLESAKHISAGLGKSRYAPQNENTDLD